MQSPIDIVGLLCVFILGLFGLYTESLLPLY
jgi:hypothetical protein